MSISTVYLGLEESVKQSFRRAGLHDEYVKAAQTRAAALELAEHYGLDKFQVASAALLHNVSRLLPVEEYLRTAEEYGLEILSEERAAPQLLHQKISRILAVEQFNINDKEALNAISCHTTLRPSATLLDKIIFLATKQQREKLKKFAFRNLSPSAAEKDLNAAAYSYLFNLINSASAVTVVHPWAKAALSDLKTKIDD